MLREELERIWRERPCIYPSNVCKWHLFQYDSGLWFWMIKPFYLVATKGRLMGRWHYGGLGRRRWL